MEVLVADGIPLASFAVQDVRTESERLKGLGLRFTHGTTEMGSVTTAVFDDTRGNLIPSVGDARQRRGRASQRFDAGTSPTL